MTLYHTENQVGPMGDHNCFGCGSVNPIGLHLTFYYVAEGDFTWASWTPTTDYEGYNGMIHGGIICTLLDEIMAWSMYAHKIWGVTAKMETKFRKPIQVGEPVRLVGRVVRDRGRAIEIRGEILLEADDSLLAEATATFMRVPKSQEEDWNRRYLGQRAEAI